MEANFGHKLPKLESTFKYLLHMDLHIYGPENGNHFLPQPIKTKDNI